ncbi:MAG: rhamnulokinase [Treponemataceae bacterium]|nr:rhamnulokinase [Treponemataceae bacterium]
MNYYLAIDIGASSGRHMLSWIEDGKIRLEEIHRFYNGMDTVDGHLCWDHERLFAEIIAGMKKCAELGKIPVSMGIDTWAVDYVLLDTNDTILGRTYAYRDHRTDNSDADVYDHISLSDLYARTGIQKQPFNTIYQLMAAKVQEPEVLAQAETMLMVPDYYNFRLTGIKKQEYTNATTTQLVNAETNDWDEELIATLGFPRKIFQPICLPGTAVGSLTDDIAKEVGFTCTVMLPATHDTGSAVLSVPSTEKDTLYISSGTWSLMGCELSKANTSPESMRRNFTNEGGYNYQYRYLKNIMGLWMIQEVRKEIAPELSFGEICDLAARSSISSTVDANDGRFLSPANMTAAVQDYCRETHQDVPETIGDLAAVIYNSLAQCYAKTVEEIESITGVTYPCVNIVGGGANADYLNRLTAKACRKPVKAGPTEATAIGNVVAQMLANKELSDVSAARELIGTSFDVKYYSL